VRPLSSMQCVMPCSGRVFNDDFPVRPVPRTASIGSRDTVAGRVSIRPAATFALHIGPEESVESRPNPSWCEFKALKALFRTVLSTATNNLTVGIWVSGCVGMRVRGNVGRNSRLRMLRSRFRTDEPQLGKGERGMIPTNPHGKHRDNRQLSWVITQMVSYPYGYVGNRF
jgi:hypothetical protein